MLKTIGIIFVVVLAWTIFKNERRAAQKPPQQVATLQDKQQAAAKVSQSKGYARRRITNRWCSLRDTIC